MRIKTADEGPDGGPKIKGRRERGKERKRERDEEYAGGKKR